jgi:hypothetical protein
LREDIFPTLPSGVEYQSTCLMRSSWRLNASDIQLVLRSPSSGVRADEKQTFLDTVQQRAAGGNILVIINCNDCAPGPDVILVARGWYVGVQCKMIPSSTIASAEVGADVANMLLPSKAFRGVQHCCIVIAGTRPPVLTVDDLAIGAAEPPLEEETAARTGAEANPLTGKQQSASATKEVAKWKASFAASLERQQLHFIYLGHDTATASKSAVPFTIPFGAQCDDETVQSNSNSAAGLKLDFNPTSRNVVKAHARLARQRGGR